MPPRPEDSAASSEGSWEAGNPFVGDPGPQHDPEAEAPEPVTPLQVADVYWQPERVRTILRAQGLLTHQAIGVGREDWLWRESELEAIAEPATNVLNKVPVTRAAAAVSDELTVGAVMFEYAFRSIRERTQVTRARKAQEPPPRRPVTGYDGQGRRVGAEQPAPDQVNWEVPE